MKMDYKNPGYKDWLAGLKPGDLVEYVAYAHRSFNGPKRRVRSLRVDRRTASQIVLVVAHKPLGPFDEVRVRAKDGMIIGGSSGFRSFLEQEDEVELSKVRLAVRGHLQADRLREMKWHDWHPSQLQRVIDVVEAIERGEDANTAPTTAAAGSAAPTPAAEPASPPDVDCGGAQHA